MLKVVAVTNFNARTVHAYPRHGFAMVSLIVSRSSCLDPTNKDVIRNAPLVSSSVRIHLVYLASFNATEKAIAKTVAMSKHVLARLARQISSHVPMDTA